MLHEGYEFLAIIGISLEILGFILMIKLFSKIPTQQDVDNFNKKNHKRIEAEHPYYAPNKIVSVRDVSGIDLGINLTVSEAFKQDWIFKTKTIPLFTVIFGLVLQGIQLFIN